MDESAHRSRGSGRWRPGSILLAATSLLLTLAFIEAGMRLLGFEPLKSLARGKDLVLRVSRDPDIRYELIPGASGRAFKTDVEVNRMGFRGPEPSGDPHRRVIVSIGDSIAFGSELPAGTAYPEQLREPLAARDSRFELINLALSGYDTLQELAVLKRHGLAFQPEVVLLGYCLNDAGIVSANAEYLNRIERYRSSPWMARSRVVQFVVSSLDRLQGRSYQEEQNRPSVFRENYRQQIDPIGADERELARWMSLSPDRHPSDWYRDADRVGRIRFAFRQLEALAEDRGFRVLVVIFPWLETDAGGAYPHRMAHRIVAHEARRQGLQVLDLLEAFEQAGLNRLRNDPEDPVHPGPEGHRLAARGIVAWMQGAGWLSPLP